MRIVLSLLFFLFVLGQIGSEELHNEEQSNSSGESGLNSKSVVSFNFFHTDMIAPGNGYFFTWQPALETSTYSIRIDAGYGQYFSENSTYVDTLLYRGGLTFATHKIFLGANYSKDFTGLTYFYYGVGTGIRGNTKYHFASGATLGAELFYGEINNLGIKQGSVFFNQISSTQTFLIGLNSEFMNKTDVSIIKVPNENNYRWGVNTAFNLVLLNNMINSKLNAGSVEQGQSGLTETMFYDFASFAPGLPQGIVTGNNYAVVENKFRVFPLKSFSGIPIVSDMLYTGLFVNAGYFLPQNNLLRDGSFSYIAGFNVGLLFFKADIGVTFAYTPEADWVFQFKMTQINILNK